jgi:hypothetical protein
LKTGIFAGNYEEVVPLFVMILDQGINQNEECEPGFVIPIRWSNLRKRERIELKKNEKNGSNYYSSTKGQR